MCFSHWKMPSTELRNLHGRYAIGLDSLSFRFPLESWSPGRKMMKAGPVSELHYSTFVNPDPGPKPPEEGGLLPGSTENPLQIRLLATRPPVNAPELEDVFAARLNHSPTGGGEFRGKRQRARRSGPSVLVPFGGASRIRTDDLLHAMQALSQLSYSPGTFFVWWS